MAIDVRHSRTATLIDNSNPDEIQADDWNDAHPVTADGMGLLFSDSAGDVAETMTVDMGTLTASTPLTFKQTWDNAALDVVFRGYRIEINDGFAANGDLTSSYFDVAATDGVDTETLLRVNYSGVSIAKEMLIFPDGTMADGTAGIVFDGDNRTMGFSSEDGLNLVEMSPEALTITVVDEFFVTQSQTSLEPGRISAPVGNFYLPAVTQTELAQWANVPTNTDIDDGHSAVGVDTNTGDIYLAANVGGTIFKVQLV